MTDPVSWWDRQGEAPLWARAIAGGLPFSWDDAVCSRRDVARVIYETRKKALEEAAASTADSPLALIDRPPYGCCDHLSSCAIHHGPAMPVGPCDCGVGGENPHPDGGK